ncbi:MAG: TIGR02444 family protein [Caulobacteraceae bacterium]|nr:TIGR02444 family protein [Caulobacteraceae bacterium]
MSLWDWTLAAYGRPGVPEACLELQDRFGRNTSFLLWAAWAGGRGRAPDGAGLAEAAATARAWEAEVLGPLREVRRRLKPARPPVGDTAREGLREDVKAAELRAERVLMETLEALTPAAGAGDAAEALNRAAEAWGGPPCAAELAALAARIG